MSFSYTEREILLSAKGIGPKVIQHLEQNGIESLCALAKFDATELCTRISLNLKASCWRNSPQARAALTSAIDIARAYRGALSAQP